MPLTPSERRDLARFGQKLAALERQVRRQRTSQGRFRSTDGGSHVVFDDDGVVRQVQGQQEDGTYTVVDLNGPPPPKPESPWWNVSTPGLLIVTGYGFTAAFEDVWPADFARFDVHVGTSDEFEYGVWTKVGEFGIDGGALTLALDPGDYWTMLVAVTTSGAQSIPSRYEGPATVVPPVTGAGGVKTYHTDEPPVGLDVDDDGAMWFDTNDGNRPNRWDGTLLEWVSVRDETIATAQGVADDALDKAGTAQGRADDAFEHADSAFTAANGKNRIIFADTEPAGTAYVVGDTWFDRANGYRVHRWDGSAWVPAEFGSTALGENSVGETQIAPEAVTEAALAVGAVTADKIDVNALNGKVITGALIRSAATGPRWEMLGTDGLQNRFEGYSGHPDEFSPSKLLVSTLDVDADNVQMDLSLQSPAAAEDIGGGTLIGRTAALGLQVLYNTATGAILRRVNIFADEVTSDAPISAPVAVFSSRYMAGALTVPASTWTQCSFGTNTETTGINFAGGVWTITRAGVYLVSAAVQFQQRTTGRRLLRGMHNGTEFVRSEQQPEGVTTDWTLDVNRPRRFAVGDTVEFQVYQSSTTALDTVAGEHASHAELLFLGK